MKKLFILSVLLVSLLKLCYAQNYIFMTELHTSEPLPKETIYSCAINIDNTIGDCQLVYSLDYGNLLSAPVIVNQGLIFSYQVSNNGQSEQVFENCPILANGLLGSCKQSSIPNDFESYYGFIVGYQQPSEGAIDKLELSDIEPKNIEIA